MAENALHGWDDEKVYYWDSRSNKERCVSDEPDLLGALEHLCDRYFRAKDGGKVEPGKVAPRRKRQKNGHR